MPKGIFAVAFCLGSSVSRAETGVVMVKPYAWSPASDAEPQPYEQFIPRESTSTIVTARSGVINVETGRLAANIRIPSPDDFVNLTAENEKLSLSATIRELETAHSKFPLLRKGIASNLASLRKVLAAYNNGSRKLEGRWYSAGDYAEHLAEEQRTIQKEKRAAQEKLRLEQETIARAEAEKTAKADEEARQVAAAKRRDEIAQEEAERQKHRMVALAVAEEEAASLERAAMASTNRRAAGRSEFNGWTMSSDGHSWQSASESAKQSLAKALAAKSQQGNSANFFYDALDSFYNSSDPAHLRTSLNDITRLTEAASTSVPRSQRNY